MDTLKEWKAVTESGATYEFDGHLISISKSTSNTWPMTMSVLKMQAPVDGVDPDNVPLPWVNPAAWQDVSEPIIGRRFYVNGNAEWRISTHIVSVEEIDGTLRTKGTPIV